jgi:predicted transcriptional regulator of viral defense system
MCCLLQFTASTAHKLYLKHHPKNELATLAKALPAGIVTADLAAVAWTSSRRTASQRLSRLAERGWLRRVRRGVYHIAPLEAASDTPSSYDDPWVMAAAVFSPCYIGGWSAAEHWGLTEQLFRETFVVSAAHVRSTHAIVGQLAFRLARVPAPRAIGDARVWRRAGQVACSSRERTIIDCANAPAWIGGVRHLVDVLARYAEQTTADIDAFTRCMESVARGVGAKRIGFIAERLAEVELDERVRSTLIALRAASRDHRSAGVVKLDPAVRSRGPMNTEWGLWINTNIVRRDHA